MESTGGRCFGFQQGGIVRRLRYWLIRKLAGSDFVIGNVPNANADVLDGIVVRRGLAWNTHFTHALQ